ncbi:MAG: lamin tail domain-containing protein [Planctomycetota bacterium]|nr:lamin tail domain-containing protein [Planctomycetota bacterium]
MRLGGTKTAFALLAASSAAFGEGRIVITEIMYNPDSNERGGATEWVELANVGDEPIQITDWKLRDEDRSGWGAFSVRLEPGGVVVLVNEKAVSEASFRAAWDADSPIHGESEPMTDPGEETSGEPAYAIIPVKWGSLANSPSAENERLKLLDEKGEVICEVNFEEGDDWPICGNPDGASIWLTDLAATDLNDGKLWRPSEAGEAGARVCRRTEVFDGADVGSPGALPPPVDRRPVAPTAEEEKTAEDEATDEDDRIDY